METGESLKVLLAAAWLLPLASFLVIWICGPWMGKRGVLGGHVATGAILCSLVLSVAALVVWVRGPGLLKEEHGGGHAAVEEAEHADSSEEHADAHDGEDDDSHDLGPSREKVAYSGDFYTLYDPALYDPGSAGGLRITIGYYIDALTVCMFCMVSLIASCIHFYSTGYMHEELDAEVVDHECSLAGGHHLHRQGRYHRFFQFLSLFCFSMFGIVIAGNLAMVFVFWELVGICSYLLIGFYRERHTASTAANKAFIVNRVGDFGMIIGLMAVWGALGTFGFDEIFKQVRPAEEGYQLVPPSGMTYSLLIVGGLGIFCGCVGKSAQFPLHVWLPDAMEGPTPVSALIHAATMVAAGVYLVGRVYPMLAPEVLLVVAYIGGITLFLAATIAITATDIKRVLAYSTVSQLGYMMLALGLGGWVAGLFHLVTHAFFKALLFLGSGSVIHACHTNEMPRMGGLRKKMPYTAYTMLAGCLAISGAGIPLANIGLSGFYSKDAILTQALWFSQNVPGKFVPDSVFFGFLSANSGVLFYLAAGGAAITAFYMFRLWYLTFAGKPRDEHVYEHAHESPKVMYVPLVILAFFAVVVAWPRAFLGWTLADLLHTAQPPGVKAASLFDVSAAAVHDYHHQAGSIAFGTAMIGFVLATMFYGLGRLNPEDVRRQFGALYRFLINKWWFDELYQLLFVAPTLFLSRRTAQLDRKVIDWFVDSCAKWTTAVSRLDDFIDRLFVDGLVNLMANWTYSLARSLRRVQTGLLRQYVMFIVLGTVSLFVILSAVWNYAVAG